MQVNFEYDELVDDNLEAVDTHQIHSKKFAMT